MGPEWIIVGIIAVAVLFGAKKIPDIARNVGRAQGEFKKGMKEGATAESDVPTQTPPTAAAPTPPPAADQPSAAEQPPE
jgi:sec-independent protein translocase protein TatA